MKYGDFMKKLSVLDKDWLARKKRKEEKKALKKFRAKRRKKKRNQEKCNSKIVSDNDIGKSSKALKCEQSYKRLLKLQGQDSKEDWTSIKVPKIFSIENNEFLTLSFFEKLIQLLEDSPGGAKIYIDSSEVETVSASALMYLIAILFDSKSEDYDIGGNFPLNSSADEFYEKCGFKELIRNFTTKISHKNKDIKIIKGDSVDPIMVKQICLFVQENCKMLDTKSLYGILIELMGNTKQHAYDEDCKLEKKWLLFAEQKNDRIDFVFLDIGLGIPKTVLKKHSEKLAKYVPLYVLDEGNIVKSALEGEYRSKTEEPNRGQGLPQVSDYFLSDIVTSATVFSGNGICKLGEDSIKKYETRKLEKEFNGTLYEWSVEKRQ